MAASPDPSSSVASSSGVPSPYRPVPLDVIEKAQRRRRRSRAGWGVVALALGVLVGVNLWTARTLSREEARARRLGVALTQRDVLGPPIPAAQDATREAQSLRASVGKLRRVPYSQIPDSRIDKIRDLTAKIVEKGRIPPTVTGDTPWDIENPYDKVLQDAARHLWSGAVRAAKKGDVERAAKDIESIHGLTRVAIADEFLSGTFTALRLDAVARAATTDVLRIDDSRSAVGLIARTRGRRPEIPSVVNGYRKEGWRITFLTQNNVYTRQLLHPYASHLFVHATYSGKDTNEKRWARAALAIPGADFLRYRIRTAFLKFFNDYREIGSHTRDPVERANKLDVVVDTASRGSWIARQLVGDFADPELARVDIRVAQLRQVFNAYLWALERRARTGRLPETGPHGYVINSDGKGFFISHPKPMGSPITESWPTSTRPLGPADPPPRERRR